MSNKYWLMAALAAGNLQVGLQAVSAPASAANIVKAGDSDNDQTLDLNEVKAAAGAHFDKLNTDGDSTLEANEVNGVIGAKMFKTADADHDGTISKDEYLALVEVLFKKADTDNDGSLTVAELRSKPAHQMKRLID